MLVLYIFIVLGLCDLVHDCQVLATWDPSIDADKCCDDGRVVCDGETIAELNCGHAPYGPCGPEAGDIGILGNLSNATKGARLYVDLSESSVFGDIGVFGQFPSLGILDLSSTQVSGDIGGLGDLKGIDYLYLSLTQVSGDLAGLANVSIYDLRLTSTQVSGDIASLANVSGFQSILILSSTWVFGDIASLAGAGNYNILNLSSTQVSGDIAGFIASIPFVAYAELDLSSTQVCGDIASLANVSFYDLRLTSTQVSGDIASLANVSFHSLDLSSTQVSGDIAGFIAKADPHGSLDLSSTQVSGDIASIANAGSYTTPIFYWNLSSTQVSGDLAGIANASLYGSFDLSSTQVCGDIASLANVSIYNLLDLSSTQVSGDIASIASIPFAPNDGSLDLSSTQVSGDIASLANVSEFHSLDLSSTQVSGDIASLANVSFDSLDLSSTKVYGDIAIIAIIDPDTLYLSSTQVSGDIASLGDLKGMETLDLSSTQVFGDIASLANASGDSLDLSSTQVSGDIASIAYASTTYLDLSSTKVSGDIAGLAHKSTVSLDLSSTKVSGDIAGLANKSINSLDLSSTKVYGDIAGLAYASINSLDLSSTKVYGDLAGLGVMGGLIILNLASTRVSGDLASLGNISTLAFLDLSSTSACADLASLGNLSSLNVAILSNCGLRGDLEVLQNTKLTTAVLHRNQLSGVLPNLSGSRLVHLTLHDNNLGGSIAEGFLPNDLSTLTLHGNHISCRLPDRSGSAQSISTQVILPGNWFDWPVPAWVRFADASLCDDPSEQREDIWVFSVTLFLGLIFNGFGLILVARRLPGLFSMLARGLTPPSDGDQFLRLTSTFLCSLLTASVWAIVLATTLYFGSGYFRCSPVVAQVTLAAVQSPGPTDAMISFLMCFWLPTVATATALFARFSWCSGAREGNRRAVGGVPRTICKLSWLILWLSGLAVMSIPTVLFAAFEWLPEDNCFKLGSNVLGLVHGGGAYFLAWASNFGVPWWTRVCRRSGVSPVLSQMLARTLVVWVVPLCASVLMADGCFRGWARWWIPCQHSGDFDVSVVISYSYVDFFGDVETRTFATPVLEQQSVCGSPPAWGRCTRDVINNLSVLYTRKMMLSAFQVPFLRLALDIFCYKTLAHDIERKLEDLVGTQVAAVDFALVLGPAFPALVPLCAAAIVTTGVCQRLSEHICKYKVTPPHSFIRTKWEVALYLMLSHMVQCILLPVAMHEMGIMAGDINSIFIVAGVSLVVMPFLVWLPRCPAPGPEETNLEETTTGLTLAPIG